MSMLPFALLEEKRKSGLPCPICGGTSFSWGDLTAQGLIYKAEDASFFDNLGKLFAGLNSLPTRVCNDCGNFQLFIGQRL